jgi:hypothetical protein
MRLNQDQLIIKNWITTRIAGARDDGYRASLREPQAKARRTKQSSEYIHVILIRFIPILKKRQYL